MIFHNRIKAGAIYYGSTAVGTIYYGARLVWEAVKSCFGKGYWIENKPWLDRDSWRD